MKRTQILTRTIISLSLASIIICVSTLIMQFLLGLPMRKDYFQENLNTISAQLVDAQALWDENGYSDYTIDVLFRSGDRCYGSLALTVNNNRLVSSEGTIAEYDTTRKVTKLEDFCYNTPEVVMAYLLPEEMFVEVNRFLSFTSPLFQYNDPEDMELLVEFDPEYGYVSYFYIGWRGNYYAYEEVEFYNFQPIDNEN